MYSQLLALLLALAASGQAPEAATPDPRLGGLTLTEALRLPREQLRERVRSTGREGERLVDVAANGYGMNAVFMSSPRAAAAGLCHSERRHVRWETTAARPDASFYRIHGVPPRSPDAPLGINYEYVLQSFFIVEGRRATRTVIPTQRTCARLSDSAPSFVAPSTGEASRAVAMFTDLQQRLARNPGSVEARCFQEPDCFARIAALRISDVAAVGPCTRFGEPRAENCRQLTIPQRSNLGFAEYVELEVEPLAAPRHRLRVSLRDMIAHFN